MSMRFWLPGVLCLILVGMVGLTVRSMTSTSARPAAPAAIDEPPRTVGMMEPVVRTRYPELAAADTPSTATLIPTTDTQDLPVGEEARAVDASPQASARDEQLAKLRASGSDAQNLTAKVNPFRVTWQTLASQSGIEVDVSPWECYRGGCFTTVVHRSPQSVEELTSKILSSQDLASWSGPQTRSASISRTDGTAEVTWFLLLPTEDGPNGGTVASH